MDIFKILGSVDGGLESSVDSTPFPALGVLLTRVLGLESTEIDEARQEIPIKALLGLLLQHEGVKTSNRFPCSLSEERVGVSCVLLYWMGGGLVQQLGLRGGLGGVPTPLVVLCARRMGNTLLLLRTPQKWQLDFWFFCILLFLICPKPVCSYF